MLKILDHFLRLRTSWTFAFQKKKKAEAIDLKEDELLGELLGEIKSSSSLCKRTPDSRLPKLSSTSKPTPTQSSGPVNPFRSTGIRRPKRPLATNDSDNFEDSDIKDFDDHDDVKSDVGVGPSQQVIFAVANNFQGC